MAAAAQIALQSVQLYSSIARLWMPTGRVLSGVARGQGKAAQEVCNGTGCAATCCFLSLQIVLRWLQAAQSRRLRCLD